MKIKEITSLTWKRFFLTLLIVIISIIIRLLFFKGLGRGTAYLTFYPAVMIAAVSGGLYSGFLSTIISAVFAYYSIQKGNLSPVEWMAMSVFLLSSVMISVISEAMRIANSRAKTAQEKAEFANKAKSAFLANMSHELRTPLNAILGYSQLMQRNTSLPDETQEYLKIINSSGEHLLRLINEVLESSKIEAGRVLLELTNFDLHGLIDGVEKMFKEKAVNKSLKFELQGVKDIPGYIIADETKFRIVLINLLGNSLKFTDKGHIIVRFSIVGPGESEKILRVEIEDTGLGISDDEKEKLFNYFVQTESGRKSQSGTGLGLAISQEYVKLMGGEIYVKSKIEEGSTFWFEIKIKEGDEKSLRKQQLSDQVKSLKHGQKIPRILVVEDTDASRKLMVKLLEATGFEVAEAINGKEALERFESWHPDLIWMDIRMPVMDGKEAAKLIKASPSGKDVLIIALSAHVFGEERKEIIEAGCDDFVGKPFRESEIFEMMKKHLSLEYIYEDSVDKNNLEVISKTLDLRKLNAAMLKELAEATENTDANKVHELSDKLWLDDPDASVILKYCANNFDYDTIKFAIENAK